MLKFSYVFSEIHVLHAGFVENQDQRREKNANVEMTLHAIVYGN